MYNPVNTALVVYIDADYVGDTMDRKSMSGFVVKIDGAFVNGGYKSRRLLHFPHVKLSIFHVICGPGGRLDPPSDE